jgi:hypothetical protein
MHNQLKKYLLEKHEYVPVKESKVMVDTELVVVVNEVEPII